jgi:uncharacterized protein
MARISFSKTALRYELTIDGLVGSFADYLVVGDAIELPRTVTDPRFRGQGLAGKLIRHVLDDVHETRGKVIPTCEYVAHFIADHPEYQPLVAVVH